MKGNIILKLSILLFIFGLVSLEANYCIQVMSTMADGKDVIIKKASSAQYLPFEDVRVEKRGSYFVFRIGDYKGYTEAKDELQKVKNISKKAFVRKCDFIKNQAVYINNVMNDTQVAHKTILSNHSDSQLLDVKNNSLQGFAREDRSKKKSIKNNKFGINEALLP